MYWSFFLEHHLDHENLIGRGLSTPAPEDMYEEILKKQSTMKEQVIQFPNNFEVKEIKDGKIVLVEKNKKLTYDDIAENLFSKPSFYISTCGEIKTATSLSKYANNPNNCTSQKQAEKLLAINKLMNVAKYLNDGWQPDWNNEEEWKYYIKIKNTDEIDIDYVSIVKCSDIYFKSKELAKQAIEILGKETIKLALCTDY